MRINGKKKLLDFMQRKPSAAPALRLWAQITEASAWHDFGELRSTFPAARLDERGRVVFSEPGGFSLLTSPCYGLDIIIVLEVAGGDDRPV